jgi:uncharacterized membrane protein YhaH (DUF805 family)
MRPFDAVRRCLTPGYVTFPRRAGRPEFWWFWLFCIVVNLLAAQIDIASGSGVAEADPWSFWDVLFTFSEGTSPASILSTVILLVPALAVGARRLHDIGRTGWWQLLLLVPILGGVVLIVFWALRPEPGTNRFGPPAAGAVSS